MSSPAHNLAAESESAVTAAIGAFQAAMNLLIVALFTLLAIASFHRYVASGSLKAFGVLAVNALVLGLFLARRPAKSETASVPLWLLGFAGTALPLLLRPAPAGSSAGVGAAIQLSGLVLLAIALLSLRRSFAVVPGNRGIQQGGSYRLVRHPVYLSELTLFLGVVLVNPTWLNGAIWVCECVLQLARARAEECFLAADPLYRAYCERVRYRLIPWVV
jgi:protein-S-isoprenylcysteine O-methyltransferase Ste14